ncbi:MAG: hypothetical protein WBY44_34375 [Bryobacteraceae bacterium]|jgi:hypothetical protein
MTNLTQAARLVRQAPRPLASPSAGMVLSGRNTRPLWFDGRFLAACDLKREQNYFLQRQAELGQAGGFGVLHGLLVDQGATIAQPASGETIVIHAGVGITPAGSLVMIPSDLTIQLSDLADEENLEVQFGLSTAPQQPARTRTGVYVVALRPVEFTANPVTSYPAAIQAPRVTQDGDIVEATAVSLVAYPNPVNGYDTSLQQAALARQIFATGNSGALSDSLLPLAMIGIDRNAIQWIDTYLVRRDSGPQYSGVRPGLTDPATQQAFLKQYDAQLQAVVASRPAGSKANFPATDYFQALPPAGRLPLDAVDTVGLTQIFFPQQMNVQLSIIPADELPAVIEEGLSLPPIDLTLPSSTYANIAVFVLIPVPRENFTALSVSLAQTQLNPALPQTLAASAANPLLQLFQNRPVLAAPISAAANPWAAAIGGQTYGFYLRRRSEPVFADFAIPTFPPAPTTTAAPPASTPAPAPTTTAPPTTTAKS